MASICFDFRGIQLSTAPVKPCEEVRFIQPSFPEQLSCRIRDFGYASHRSALIPEDMGGLLFMLSAARESDLGSCRSSSPEP